MRTPSSETDLLAWHTAYMAGQNPPVHDGAAQCGWYRTQLRKNGPWVPVIIWCDREIDPETGELCGDEVMIADVFGEERDANDIWTYLTPISRDEFDRLTEWRLSNQHRLDSHRPVDLALSPTLPGV